MSISGCFYIDRSNVNFTVVVNFHIGFFLVLLPVFE